MGSNPTPGTEVNFLLIALLVALAVYAGVVLAFALAGRDSDARAAARFVPDCVVLFKRLLGDPRVDLWRKALLVVVIVYLVSPIDLIPDFIPVAGQLDDAILVVVALRVLLHGSGQLLLTQHWPGPQRSLQLILRLAY